MNVRIDVQAMTDSAEAIVRTSMDLDLGAFPDVSACGSVGVEQALTDFADGLTSQLRIEIDRIEAIADALHATADEFAARDTTFLHGLADVGAGIY